MSFNRCPASQGTRGQVIMTVQSLSIVPYGVELPKGVKTNGIAWTISNVQSDWGQLINTERSLSFVPESLGRLDTYWGTFDIAWTISFVPTPFGTIDNDWTVIITCPRVPWEAGHLLGDI